MILSKLIRNLILIAGLGIGLLGCSQTTPSAAPLSPVVNPDTPEPLEIITLAPLTDTPDDTGEIAPIATATPTPTIKAPEEEPPPSPEDMTEPTLEGCPRPNGWVTYMVRLNDTLFSLGQKTSATVTQLQAANCKSLDDTLIFAGQPLYLPFFPASSPTNPPDPSPPTSTPEVPPPSEVPAPPAPPNIEPPTSTPTTAIVTPTSTPEAPPPPDIEPPTSTPTTAIVTPSSTPEAPPPPDIEPPTSTPTTEVVTPSSTPEAPPPPDIEPPTSTPEPVASSTPEPEG